MDSLIERHSFSRSHIIEGLQSLPRDVDEAYENVFDRIEQQNLGDTSRARKVLSFVTCARRPLTVRELREALAIEPGMKTLELHSLIDDEIWISACAGL